jgi:Na+-transporting methylmalonyl-CoA/oxaloacetate decarboxylase gamma subunit
MWMAVDNLTFAVTMIVVGMGGTLLTLWLLTLLIDAMKKIFPADKPTEKK